MNPSRYFIPYNNMINSGFIGSNYMVPRGIGLFGRIGNTLKSFNWSGLLNNANKTLNVVNQTIPLVRQAGPMFNNMKNMVKIARAFGSETGNKSKKNVNINNNSNDIKNNVPNDFDKIEKLSIQKNYNNSLPNFFV